MHFLILTGMSGAGKTVALRYLEDLGALCVDNLPPMMLVPFMESCQKANIQNPLIAIGADVRSGEFFDAVAVTGIINEARLCGYQIDTLFVEASNDVLMNRYKESRREHPLMGDGLMLQQAIAEERNRLQPLREAANHLFDTTDLKPRALQKKLKEMVEPSNTKPSLRIEIMSFGFKRGIPREADLMFDVRFLPNPFYIKELGHHTGLDQDVKDFVLLHPVTKEFLQKCMDMLLYLIPNYVAEGKHRLVIGIGCTGGAHRSVAIAEYINAELTKLLHTASVQHRDIALEKAHWASKSEYEVQHKE